MVCHEVAASGRDLSAASIVMLISTVLAMQVDAEGLFTALTTRAIETRGERIVKQLSAAAAIESRDALAKSLYSRLFDWLVAAINRKISALGKLTHMLHGLCDFLLTPFILNSAPHNANSCNAKEECSGACM